MNTMDVARMVALSGGMNGLDYYNMQGLGDPNATRPRVVGLPQAPQGHSTRDAVFGAIGAGLQILNNWVVTRPGAQVYAPAQPPQYQAQAGVPPGQQVGAAAGQGFSNFAAQFGVSPTTMVLLMAGGAYLLLRQPPR